MYAIFKNKHRNLTSVLLYPAARSEHDIEMNKWLREHNEKADVGKNFVELTDESLVAFKLKFGK